MHSLLWSVPVYTVKSPITHPTYQFIMQKTLLVIIKHRLLKVPGGNLHEFMKKQR